MVRTSVFALSRRNETMSHDELKFLLITVCVCTIIKQPAELRDIRAKCTHG